MPNQRDLFLSLLRIVRDNMDHVIPASVLGRLGMDRAFCDNYAEPSVPNLPDGAAEYLQYSNPRLKELKERYSQLNLDVLTPSRWTAEYVAADLPLERFRGDCALVWQQRDLNLPSAYALTYYYLCASGHESLLRSLTEDDLFGPYTLIIDGEYVSRDRLDSLCEILFLDQFLRIGNHKEMRVLDIGSGYGRLAHRLVQAFDNTCVLCADVIPEAAFLCEYYLGVRQVSDRAQIIAVDEIDRRLADTHVDVAVNIHSFSECPARAIVWWLELLKSHAVPYLMIVPNPEYHGGTQLLSSERGPERKNFMPIVTDAGYHLVAMEPKFREVNAQRFGITPTHYFMFKFGG